MKNICKKILLVLIMFISVDLYAKDHENGYKWNVTIKDYSDKSTIELLNTLYDNANKLDEALRYGRNSFYNPLNEGKLQKSTITLYSAALSFWCDYLKLVFCNADGLKYLSKTDIDRFNDLFPDLCRFVDHFYAGDYTNGLDPHKSVLLTGKLKETVNTVERSLEQMAPRVKNLDYYLDNYAAIPLLEKKSNSNIFIIILIVIIVLFIALVFISLKFRNRWFLFEKIAEVVDKIFRKNKKDKNTVV